VGCWLIDSDDDSFEFKITVKLNGDAVTPAKIMPDPFARMSQMPWPATRQPQPRGLRDVVDRVISAVVIAGPDGIPKPDLLVSVHELDLASEISLTTSGCDWLCSRNSRRRPRISVERDDPPRILGWVRHCPPRFYRTYLGVAYRDSPEEAGRAWSGDPRFAGRADTPEKVDYDQRRAAARRVGQGSEVCVGPSVGSTGDLRGACRVVAATRRSMLDIAL
jgi:hypothetical protein